MSKKTELTERTISEERTIGIVCDACAKDISGAYLEVTTSHGDWGNDSIESIQTFDFCSAECMSPHMVAYFKNARGSEEYDVERRVHK
jgi:hypothetical protein